MIGWLETVFEENIHTVAEEELQKLALDKNKRVGFTYASTVLFPETFIHQLEALGNSREEAEEIFLEDYGEEEEEGEEERLALRREIKEAAAKIEELEAEDYKEEWVNHSDLDE